jgi:hypothetical protein
MIWLPSAPIVSAIVASLSLPLFMILVAHGPWRPDSPMRHFLTAAALACALLIVLLLLTNGAADWPDLFAALVLLAASLLAQYTLWSLIVWGFTSAMLNVLEQRQKVDSVEAWCRAYAGDTGIDAFALNRCGLLLSAGFARFEPSRTLSITPRGQRAAHLVKAVRWLFGLRQP